MASHVFAGFVAFQPIPCEVPGQEIARVGVVMDVGYYIHIIDQDPLYIMPDASQGDPFLCYSGCKTTDVVSNFHAKLEVSVVPTSPAGGRWQARIYPDVVDGSGTVKMCVYAKELYIINLGDPSEPTSVAELVIRVHPVY
jgi:hypothetical protein